MVKCKSCGISKNLSEYYISNKIRCKHCFDKRTLEYIKASRRNPEHAYKWVYTDSKASDRKRGLDFDLSKNQIKELLDAGCSYCHSTDGRMTLDRIDNKKGHTKDNVRTACERCNYMRRDMPYAAWLYLTPFVKEAKDKGLFGEWVGGVHRK